MYDFQLLTELDLIFIMIAIFACLFWILYIHVELIKLKKILRESVSSNDKRGK